MLSSVSAGSQEHSRTFLDHVRDVPGKGAVEGVAELGQSQEVVGEMTKLSIVGGSSSINSLLHI